MCCGNGTPFEIEGIAQPAFRGLSRGGFFPQADILLPLAAQPVVAPRWTPPDGSLFTARNVGWVWMLLRSPRDRPAARTELELGATLGRQLGADANPGEGPVRVRVLPGAQGVERIQPENRRVLLLASGVAAMLLVITCVNLSALLLARGAARRREMAVRRALGASRPQLAGQLLVESLLLAGAGAVLGLLLTWWTRALLTPLLTAGLGSFGIAAARTLDVRIDATLLLVTTAAAFVAALLSGLLPAFRLTAVDPTDDLKHRAVGSDRPRLTLGRSLIALQIGISAPLVVAAILLLRTLANLGAVPLGFDPRGIAVFRLNPDYTGAPAEDYGRIYLDVVRTAAAIPGVTSVTLVENALMSGLVSDNSITIDDQEPRPILMNGIGPGFFETMGMQLLAGRAPGEQDHAGTPNVGVVNQAAVERLFGGASPNGRTVRIGSREVQIVGVVNDSRYHRQRAAVQPILFDAALQRGGFGGHHIVLRTSALIGALEPALRRAVAAVHPDLVVPVLHSQLALIDQSNARERAFTHLLTLFGVFALVLAGIGLHGVTSYAVARRTNEIGVRMVLGARPAAVHWLVLRQVMVLAGFGLAIGLPLSLVLASLTRALLFGVTPGDPVTLGLAVLVMVAVAGGTGLLPARRAARLDPLVALRAD